MQFTRDYDQHCYYITACTAEKVTIKPPVIIKDNTLQNKGVTETHDTSFIISAQQLTSGHLPAFAHQLEAQHLALLADQQPEIALLGTGAQLVWPRQEIFAALYQQGIGVEVMNNGAACRTFNVLVAEGRKVSAMILMNDGLNDAKKPA